MKKLILMAVLCCGVMGTALAQDEMKAKRDPAVRADAQTEMMSKRLELTEEQKVKVKEINISTTQEMQAHGRESQEVRMAILQKRDERMKGILSEEQYKKYIGAREERMQKMQQRHHEMKK